ncbi:MAG: hypothetical protein AAF191_11080, partial [Verrucomicrobiota bacterium]
MKRHWIVLLLLLLSFSNESFSQEKAEQEEEAPKTAPEEAKKSNKATDEAQKKAEEEEKKRKEAEQKRKKERLDLIGKLKFDRTTRKVLEAWAPIPKDEKEEEDDSKKVEEEKKDETEEERKAKAEQEAFAEQLETLTQSVSQGDWDDLPSLWEAWSEDEAEKAYRLLLGALTKATPSVIPDLDPLLLSAIERYRVDQQQPALSSISFEDVFAVIRVRPTSLEELEEEDLAHLGNVLRTSVEAGNDIDQFVDRFLEEKDLITRREVAKLMKFSNHPSKMGPFLPDIDTAVSEDDHEALNLLADYHVSTYRADREKGKLANAWAATQAVLAAQDVKGKEREVALKQAVTLSSQVSEEMGETWLKETFTSKPERGKEVLRVIGSTPPYNLERNPSSTNRRLESLQLQSTAVESLIEMAPDQSQEWKDTLNILAVSWLREAEFSHRYDQSQNQQRGYQRDRYGNYYYSETPSTYIPNRTQPIRTDELLESKPSAAWLALLDPSLRPQFDQIYAKLYLKIGEEDKAFPFVETVARQSPDKGEALVEGYLDLWTKNHDPNASNRQNYYGYYYGYERRAESIPLTRSKQERNLRELAEVVERLRALPLRELDEERLANAFMVSHSSAEVYRLEAIEKVFGSVDDLEPKTLAALTQRMRRNLAGVWRKPEEQKKQKTNRKQKDIEAEVLRGYQVCRSVVKTALEKHPDSWRLHLARAAIAHDQNNYDKELNQNSDYSEKRQDALDGFARAADLYVASAGEREEDEETAEPFQQWLYASLGSTELSLIDDVMVSAQKEPARIRQALEGLEEKAQERHFTKFAQSLFLRMSGVKPAVKHRYLRAGFEIVGDHEEAEEAREVYDYYQDLITEIQLEAEVDGSNQV